MSDEWTMKAYQAVATAMVLFPEFSADDVWAVLDHWGVPEPAKSSTMGSVMNTLTQRRVIEKTGDVVSSMRPASRYRKISVYRPVDSAR